MTALFGDSDVKSEVDLPEWLKPYWQENLEKQAESQDFATAVRDAMTGWRPEGWSEEEDAALGMLSDLPGQTSGLENAATGFLQAGTEGLRDLERGAQGITEEELAGFYDPYNEAVIASTIRDMEEQSKRQQMQDEARAAAAGGITGSRNAVADILRERQLGRETADVGNRLRSDAFRWAAEASQGRKKDFGTAAGQYSQLADQLATTKTSRDRAIAGDVAAMGETKRTGSNVQDMWPMQLQDWYQGQVGGGISSPGQVSTGTKSGGGPSGFSQLLGAGTTLGSAYLMSDERLKVDIGEAPGLETLRQIEPKSYRYIGDDNFTAGVIAQNVEDVLPNAVTTEPASGFKAVDLAPVVSTLIKSVKQLDDRTRKPVRQRGIQ